MIKFKDTTELTIVTEFDEKNDNIVEETTEVFQPDEVVDATIISEDGDYVDLEFDAGVALGVQRSCFVELREHCFSPHTDECIYCGCSVEDDAVGGEPCVEKE